MKNLVLTLLTVSAIQATAQVAPVEAPNALKTVSVNDEGERLNAFVNGGFIPATKSILVTCLPATSQDLISVVTVEIIDRQYQTRIKFKDGKEEVFLSKVVIAAGDWDRLVIARQAIENERVISFDIMSPRFMFDYGHVLIKTDGEPASVIVQCERAE